ncbi:hypothetical protein BGX31_000505 [Mortierella sp. GBA43]|nr:hypothetical protein BGX31_000505 [Mortierella sp. GBA43]
MATRPPTPEELAAHRKRQQEFEEAARKVQSLVDNVRHDPMKLHKITVHGTNKTRTSFMHRILQPAFEARSLHEVIGLSRRAVRRMERFGIYEDIKIQLDSPSDPWLQDRKDLVDLGVWLKEGSRLQIRTGTEAGNAEASMYGAILLKNVFGGAETLSSSMSFGTRTSSAFQFTLATPVLADPDQNLSLNIFSQARNNTQWSSYEEELKGGSVKYSYAGLGGDVNHVRQELEAQVARSNNSGYIVTATVKSGYLHSLDGKPSKISDRFFLGGPMSVRGFKSYGLGPREGEDSLGGEAFVSAGLSLLTPFPGLSNWDSFKVHFFANAGSLINVKPGQSPKTTVEDLTKAPSTSIGAGILYRHPQVRIELNFALPLTATKTDAVSRGWQLGLGISFL